MQGTLYILFLAMVITKLVIFGILAVVAAFYTINAFRFGLNSIIKKLMLIVMLNSMMRVTDAVCQYYFGVNVIYYS